MPLVRPLNILKEARRKKEGVLAINVLSLETLKGVVQAAEELNKPIILQVSSNGMKWAEFEYIVPMIISVAKNSKVNLAVHLDHCKDIELINKCVNAGFTSIMYDGSHFDFETNVNNSKKVIEKFKDKVNIELEIGYVGGKEGDKEDKDNEKLSVEDVRNFYSSLKPDTLAVSFGTSHGIYKGNINLDFDFLNDCSKSVPVPLVMHGTSGVPFKDIKKSIKNGITKINIGTDILVAYQNAVRKFSIENPDVYDIRKINNHGIKAIKEKVIEYLKIV